MMWSALTIAARFLWLNATVRDPRAERRHNWRWVLFVFVDGLLFRYAGRKAGRAGTLVVLVNRLGDAIVSKPLIEAIRRDFETEPLTVLGDRSWQVLADTVYEGTTTHFIDERRFRLDFVYRLKTVMWMRRQRFRRAFCFMHHRLEMRDDALVALSGADERIVIALPPSFFKYRWYPWIYAPYRSWMTRVVPADDSLGSVEVLDAARDAIRKVPHVFERHRRFYAALTDGRDLPRRRLQANAGAFAGPRAFVVLSFGASARERCWPLPAYVDLASRLIAADYDVVFAGGPAELAYRDQLLEMIAGKAELRTDRVSVFVNELSFAAIMSLYSSATCLVGTDTGGSHLALWLGVPLVTILHVDRLTAGYDRLGDFFPYPVNVPFAPYRAVWTTPDEFRRTDAAGAGDRVWAAVQSLLTRT